MTNGWTTRIAAEVAGTLAAAVLAALVPGCARRGGDVIVLAPPVAPTTAPATSADSPADGSAALTVDWRPFAEALANYVTDDGRVDYFHLAQPKSYQGLLDVYARIARTGPASDPRAYPSRNARLAYYINAYNLFAVLAIGPYFGPGKIDPSHVRDLPVPLETGFVFVLDRANLSLDRIRRERIEPLLAGDPRPLLALCSGRRNDPPLRRELYQPGKLDVQLADQLVRVLGTSPWCEIDYWKMEVQLPGGVADHRDYYWSGYLARAGHLRKDVRFVTVLMSLADERGRRWLNRAIGYKVVRAAPSERFNNRPLFRALDD